MSSSIERPIERAEDLRGRACARCSTRWASPQLPPRLTVAFSGGLDSTVLLAALCRLELPARVRAAHVDHGLHPSRPAWSAHCAATAAGLGAEFVAVRVAVDRAARAAVSRRPRARRAIARSARCWRPANGCSRPTTATISSRRCCSACCAARVCAACAASSRSGRSHGGLAGPARCSASRASELRDAGARLESRLARGSGEPRAAPRPQLPAPARAARARARWPSAAQHARAPRRADERGGTAARRGGGRGRAGPRGALARAAGGARRAAAGAAAQPVALLAAGRRRRYPERAQGRGAARRAARSARRLATRSCVGRAAKAAYFARHCISVAPLPPARHPTHRGAHRHRRRLDRPRRAARVRAGKRCRRLARVVARRGADAAVPRRRRTVSSARPPASLAEASVPGERRRAVDARPRAAAVSRRTPSSPSATLDQRATSTPHLPIEPRWRVQWTRASAPCMHRNGASRTPRATRGWSCRGTFDTLQYRLDAPNTQLRWPDDGFPREGRPALPVLT